MTCPSCSGTKVLSGAGAIPHKCPACLGTGSVSSDAPVIRVVLTTYLPQSNMFAGRAYSEKRESLAVRVAYTEADLKERLGFGGISPHYTYSREYPKGYRLEYDRTAAAPVGGNA